MVSIKNLTKVYNHKLTVFKNLYYYPVVDLLFEKTHPIIIVDVIIFIVLLFIVSKIRLTEK